MSSRLRFIFGIKLFFIQRFPANRRIFSRYPSGDRPSQARPFLIAQPTTATRTFLPFLSGKFLLLLAYRLSVIALPRKFEELVIRAPALHSRYQPWNVFSFLPFFVFFGFFLKAWSGPLRMQLEPTSLFPNLFLVATNSILCGEWRFLFPSSSHLFLPISLFPGDQYCT